MSYESYTVAIICTKSFEMSAVHYMLDRENHRLERMEGDSSTYALGELYGNNIVLACLPGNQGKGSAAIIATNLACTFPAIALRFLVGVDGGVPSGKNDIRLGVVMEKTDYGFVLKGFLQHPPPLLRSAIEIMRSDHLIGANRIEEFISMMLQKDLRLSVYQQRSIKTDTLFEEGVGRQKIVQRRKRQFTGPEIHYSLIASGDTVMRSSSRIDRRYFDDVFCFEMEAAGLMTEYSYLVVRGISNYADPHKNDSWNSYAAATAAACTKKLISYL
ncbi:nucleoside phosphorylase domain-containing protein [Trichoderma barbatum]